MLEVNVTISDAMPSEKKNRRAQWAADEQFTRQFSDPISTASMIEQRKVIVQIGIKITFTELRIFQEYAEKTTKRENMKSRFRTS